MFKTHIKYLNNVEHQNVIWIIPESEAFPKFRDDVILLLFFEQNQNSNLPVHAEPFMIYQYTKYYCA